MATHFRKFLLLHICAAVVLTACQDQHTPVSIAPTEPSTHAAGTRSVSRSPFGRFRPGEEESVVLARELPGFGGFYIDSVGDLHAYLLDVERSESAHSALAGVLARRQRSYTETERGLRPRGGIIIHQGQFTFYQLADWRNDVEGFTTTVPGVVWVGLDEHLNRVAVGVDRSRPAAVHALVVRRLGEMGIPPEAVAFETTDAIATGTADECAPEAIDCQDPCTLNPSDPACGGDVCAINPDDPSCESTDPCAMDPGACDPGPDYTVEPPDYTLLAAPPKTLGSPFAPQMGGVRIRSDVGGSCTLGFVVTYQGRKAFVTNSHCTRKAEYLDQPRTEFFQPDWSRSAVGREWIDDYKRAMGYRMADASIAELINGYQGSQAYVARPATRSYRMHVQTGDTTLASGSSPWIRITGEGGDCQRRDLRQDRCEHRVDIRGRERVAHLREVRQSRVRDLGGRGCVGRRQRSSRAAVLHQQYRPAGRNGLREGRRRVLDEPAQPDSQALRRHRLQRGNPTHLLMGPMLCLAGAPFPQE